MRAKAAFLRQVVADPGVSTPGPIFCQQPGDVLHPRLQEQVVPALRSRRAVGLVQRGGHDHSSVTSPGHALGHF
jgi:hypothetical protein